MRYGPLPRAIEHGCHREVRAPGVLDVDSPVLPPQRLIERQVIEQRVTWKRVALEAPAGHEHVVRADIDLLGREQHRKSTKHGRAGAGAAEDIEVYAALREGLEHADMRGAEAAATGGDIAHRTSGQESMQAPEVEVVLKRHVVVHPHVVSIEPGSGAINPAGALLVQANQSSPRRRMRLDCKRLERFEVIGRCAGYHKQELVGLPDRLACPVAQGVVGEVCDQFVFVLDRIEPAGDCRIVRCLAGKMALQVVAGEQASPAATPDHSVEAIEERLRDRLITARDDRDGARSRAALRGRSRGSAVDEPPGKRTEQCLMDRRYVSRGFVERRAIELKHDRIARCDHRCSPGSAGEEAGLADRFADADFSEWRPCRLQPRFQSGRRPRRRRNPTTCFGE